MEKLTNIKGQNNRIIFEFEDGTSTQAEKLTDFPSPISQDMPAGAL